MDLIRGIECPINHKSKVYQNSVAVIKADAISTVSH